MVYRSLSAFDIPILLLIYELMLPPKVARTKFETVQAGPAADGCTDPDEVEGVRRQVRDSAVVLPGAVPSYCQPIDRFGNRT